jgi:Ca2+/Na+ antiporter
MHISIKWKCSQFMLLLVFFLGYLLPTQVSTSKDPSSRHWIWLKYCCLVFYIKKYFKAKKKKKEKTQIYFTMQKYNLNKKSSKKETKILEDIITLWLISSFNTIQNISSFKNPHIKINLLLLPRGQNPLSYHTLYWI